MLRKFFPGILKSSLYSQYQLSQSRVTGSSGIADLGLLKARGRLAVILRPITVSHQ